VIKEIREAFEEGLSRGVEKGGAMLAESSLGADGGLTVQLLRIEQESFETEDDAMCLGDHFPFTFHTHPILIEKGRADNHPMIPSNTDITGLLETSAYLHAPPDEGKPLPWPESPKWKVRSSRVLEDHKAFHEARAAGETNDLPGSTTWLDVLASPLGLIVYHPTMHSIVAYREHMKARKARNEWDRKRRAKATPFDVLLGTHHYTEACERDGSDSETWWRRSLRVTEGIGYECWEASTLPLSSDDEGGWQAWLARCAGDTTTVSAAVRQGLEKHGLCFKAFEGVLKVHGAKKALQQAWEARYNKVADAFDTGRSFEGVITEQLLILGALVGPAARSELLFCVMNAPLWIQQAWFSSKPFLSHDWARDPKVTEWLEITREVGIGVCYAPWQSTTVSFKLPCPPHVRGLLEWHASPSFWKEVRLDPITERCGAKVLSKLEGTPHERVVSKTRRGAKISLPWKHWGYRLHRALQESHQSAGE